MTGSEESVEYIGRGRGFLGLWKPQDSMEKRNLAGRRAVLPFLAIALVIQLARAALDGLTTGIAVTVTVVVLLLLVFYGVNSCLLRITESSVQLRYFGVTRKIKRSEITRIADVIVTESSQYSTTENRYLLLLNDEGHSAGKVSQLSFSVEVLKDVINRLQVPVANLHAPRSPKDLREIYPHSFSWLRCHPILSGLLLTPAIIAVVVAVAAIISVFD